MTGSGLPCEKNAASFDFFTDSVVGCRWVIISYLLTIPNIQYGSGSQSIKVSSVMKYNKTEG